MQQADYIHRMKKGRICLRKFFLWQTFVNFASRYSKRWPDWLLWKIVSNRWTIRKVRVPSLSIWIEFVASHKEVSGHFQCAFVEVTFFKWSQFLLSKSNLSFDSFIVEKHQHFGLHRTSSSIGRTIIMNLCSELVLFECEIFCQKCSLEKKPKK